MLARSYTAPARCPQDDKLFHRRKKGENDMRYTTVRNRDRRKGIQKKNRTKRRITTKVKMITITTVKGLRKKRSQSQIVRDLAEEQHIRIMLNQSEDNSSKKGFKTAEEESS